MATKRPAKAEMRATLDAFILEVGERNESVDLDAAQNPRPPASPIKKTPSRNNQEHEE